MLPDELYSGLICGTGKLKRWDDSFPTAKWASVGATAWLLCPAVTAVGVGSAGSKAAPEELYCKRLSVTAPHRFRQALAGALRLTLIRF